jgi:hypothetical protein
MYSKRLYRLSSGWPRFGGLDASPCRVCLVVAPLRGDAVQGKWKITDPAFQQGLPRRHQTPRTRLPDPANQWALSRPGALNFHLTLTSLSRRDQYTTPTVPLSIPVRPYNVRSPRTPISGTLTCHRISTGILERLMVQGENDKTGISFRMNGSGQDPGDRR